MLYILLSVYIIVYILLHIYIIYIILYMCAHTSYCRDSWLF